MEEIFKGYLVDGIAAWLNISPGLATFMVVILLLGVIGSFTLMITRSIWVTLISQGVVLLVLAFTGLAPLWIALLPVVLLLPLFLSRSLEPVLGGGGSGIECPECKSRDIKLTHQEAAPDFCECRNCGTSFLKE